MDRQPINTHPTWVPHAKALRMHGQRAIIGTLAIVIICLVFHKNLLSWALYPLQARVDHASTQLIAIGVFSPLLAPLMWALYLALAFSLPWIIYQLYTFLMPALYPNERHKVCIIACCAMILFYAGMAFAYFIILPTMLLFIAKSAPEQLLITTDIHAYLHILIRSALGCGIGFQLPLLTTVLVASGKITPYQIQRLRPYAVIGVLILAMLLTPPDIFSQIFLAIPLWLLFEIGFIVGKFYQHRSKKISSQK